jgi:hypothetical protein
VEVRLDDYFDNTIIFSTASSDIQKNKDVFLDLNFNYLDQDTSLKVQGMVIELDDDGEGGSFITVEIASESVASLESFMDLYQTRQKNINYFMAKVKGL